MLTSRQKNKIYALASIFVIAIAVISFALTVNFLVKMEDYVFGVDEKIIKEKTATADKQGFEKIKGKLKQNGTGVRDTIEQ